MKFWSLERGSLVIEAHRIPIGTGLGVELWNFRRPVNEDPYDDRRWDFTISLGPLHVSVCWGRFEREDDD